MRPLTSRRSPGRDCFRGCADALASRKPTSRAAVERPCADGRAWRCILTRQSRLSRLEGPPSVQSQTNAPPGHRRRARDARVAAGPARVDEGFEVRTAKIGRRGRADLPDLEARRRSSPTCMLPDIDGIELLRRFKQTNAGRRGGGDDRPRQRPARRRGDAGRRVQLPREARRARRAAGDSREGARAPAARQRERAAEAAARGPVPARRTSSGSSRRMHDLLELVENVAPSDANILIQGENGTGKELIANALHYNSKRVEGAVHQDQLRGDPEGPDRVGAVRLQEGRLHRRDAGQGRAARAAERRVAAARRDWRDAAVPADEAAARAAGARVPADRQRPHRARRLPADLRDQRRPRGGAAATAGCARTSTSASTRSR